VLVILRGGRHGGHISRQQRAGPKSCLPRLAVSCRRRARGALPTSRLSDAVEIQPRRSKQRNFSRWRRVSSGALYGGEGMAATFELWAV